MEISSPLSSSFRRKRREQMLLPFVTTCPVMTFIVSAFFVLAPFVGFAQANKDNVTSSPAKLPFAGSFFDSVTGEKVRISSTVQVDTQVTLSASTITLDLKADLPKDFNASGESTGCIYIPSSYPNSLHSQRPRPASSPFHYRVAANFSLMYLPFPVPKSHRGCNKPRPPYTMGSDTFFVELDLYVKEDGTLLVGGDSGSAVRLCGEKACKSDGGK